MVINKPGTFDYVDNALHYLLFLMMRPTPHSVFDALPIVVRVIAGLDSHAKYSTKRNTASVRHHLSKQMMQPLVKPGIMLHLAPVSTAG